MVQDQLVDYVSSQMKLGVSRDAIKSALISAGWVSADVEDTIKKVEGNKTAQPSSQPLGQSFPSGANTSTSKPVSFSVSATALSSSPIGGSSKSSSGGPEGQTIRVSDLVSASDSPIGASFDSKLPKGNLNKMNLGKDKPVTQTSYTSPVSSQNQKGGRGMKIGAIFVIIVLAGVSVWLYLENNALSAKIATLGTTSTDVASQLSSLTSQVQSLTASSATLSASVDSLTAANKELTQELSFYALPPNTASGVALPITVGGTLSGGGKIPYVLTTVYGAKIYVQNSSDAKIVAVLKPLVGATAQLSGTYIPTSDTMTVTSVNGSTPSSGTPPPTTASSSPNL